MVVAAAAAAVVRALRQLRRLLQLLLRFPFHRLLPDPLLEIALVFVRFDHVARFIVNAKAHF